MDGGVSLGEGEIEICRSSELSGASGLELRFSTSCSGRHEVRGGGRRPHPVILCCQADHMDTLASSTGLRSSWLHHTASCPLLLQPQPRCCRSGSSRTVWIRRQLKQQQQQQRIAAAVTEGGGPRPQPSSCTASVGAAGAVNSTPLLL